MNRYERSDDFRVNAHDGTAEFIELLHSTKLEKILNGCRFNRSFYNIFELEERMGLGGIMNGTAKVKLICIRWPGYCMFFVAGVPASSRRPQSDD